MSGLFSSLNASVMALNAHSRSIEIAGKNLANVSNPDYARQRVIYGDRGTVVTPDGAESLGLEALGIQQLRDTLLDQQVVREAALSAYYEAQQNGYQRAQAGLGQNVASAGSTSGVNNSAGDTGIGAALDDFFNAFQSFASNPTDTGVRQALLQTTTVLTDRLQLADKRLAQVQTDLDSQVTADVAETNQLLQTIADLNDQIAQVEINHPGSAVDLRDQRQAALEKLGTKFPFEGTEAADGQIQIIGRTAASAPVVLVSGSKVTGPVTFDTSTTPATIRGGSPATALRLTSGSIQGSLDARNIGLTNIRTQLNQLAGQLVLSVNTAYRAGGGTTDFFDPAQTTAGKIQLDASVSATSLRASNSGLAGDNTVALAIARLATQRFSTTNATPDVIDGTFSNFYAGAVSGLGQAVAGATARVEDQNRIEELVRSQRDAVSGVSLDEEMANLMKFQRAFQASSRVFETIDNLLDVVVNQMGNR